MMLRDHSYRIVNGIGIAWLNAIAEISHVRSFGAQFGKLCGG